MSISPYVATRDSGILWLGNVPSHWEVCPLKHLISLRSGGTPSKARDDFWGGSVPWASAKDLKSAQISDTADRLTELAVAEGGVELNPAGSILILVRGMMLARAFPVVETLVPMAINQDLKAVHPKQGMTSSFLAWTLRGTARESLDRCSEAGHGTKALRMEDWLTMPFPVPPSQEQVAIAAFLDGETAKIDALIEEQRRLIALLKEKRQAVTSHAVTKGLDPQAPMKDSGIDWLGQVPSHWTVAPLKRTAAVLAGYAFAANAFSHDDNNPRLLRGINLSASGIRWNEDTVYWERSEGDGLSAWELRVGDVVLGMDRPWIGDGLRVAEITEKDLPCMLLQRVAAVRADCPSAQRFILHCLRHEAFFHHCAPEMTGVSVPHISGGQIEEFRMPIPPADEMDAIAAHIDNRSNEFAALISAAQSAIELLGERRAALISAAVTGKIDVRGSAKVLPFPIERARARRFVATEIIERLAHQPTFGRTKLQKVAYLAEAHASITELAGCYIRMPYGPLDQTMMDEIEANGGHDGIAIDDKHDGSMVRYRATGKKGGNTADLRKWLGDERYAKLDHLIKVLSGLKTHSAEAIATLYAVWNDALIEGRSPTDEQIISAFFGWHPKKAENFSPDELPHWLDWMRRHGIVPTGSGPKTMSQIGTLL